MKPRIKRMLLLTAGLIIIMYGIPNLAFYLLPKWIDALVGFPLAFFLLYKFLMWWESRDRVQYFESAEDEFGDDAYSWVGAEERAAAKRIETDLAEGAMSGSPHSREFNLQAEQRKIAKFFDEPNPLEETEEGRERLRIIRAATYLPSYPLLEMSEEERKAIIRDYLTEIFQDKRKRGMRRDVKVFDQDGPIPDANLIKAGLEQSRGSLPMKERRKKRPILYLNVKRKWFTMSVAGIKKEEYRQIKPYYERIIQRTPDGWKIRIKGELHSPEDIAICFANGYAKDRRKVCVTCTGLRVGEGRPEWGAKPGVDYFVFGLGYFISYEMHEDE